MIVAAGEARQIEDSKAPPQDCFPAETRDLVATHYCPIGSQPRLRLKLPASSDRFVFDFVSATNLPDASVADQQMFEIKILSKDSLWRSEIYVEKGEKSVEAVTYSRLR